jgi:hypothetical protein
MSELANTDVRGRLQALLYGDMCAAVGRGDTFTGFTADPLTHRHFRRHQDSLVTQQPRSHLRGHCRRRRNVGGQTGLIKSSCSSRGQVAPAYPRRLMPRRCAVSAAGVLT